ncbi:MAG: hypothetical protein K0Q63_1244, partial [Paenibacillus sp.]|nr:hypothetical protein [Paenibacillus sp.]
HDLIPSDSRPRFMLSQKKGQSGKPGPILYPCRSIAIASPLAPGTIPEGGYYMTLVPEP